MRAVGARAELFVECTLARQIINLSYTPFVGDMGSQNRSQHLYENGHQIQRLKNVVVVSIRAYKNIAHELNGRDILTIFVTSSGFY